MPDNTIIQPEISVSNSLTEDGEDEELRITIDQLDKNNPIKSAKLVIKSIDIIQKGENPEKDKIISFLHGLYYELLSRPENDMTERLRLLKRSLYFYKQVKETKKEMKRVEANILLVEAAQESRRKNILSSSDLYYKAYLSLKKIEDNKTANFALGMHCMLKGGSRLGRPEAIEIFKQGENAFEEGGFIDGAHKIKSLKFNVLAQYSPTIEEAIEYLKKGIEETQKTSDKYGLELEQSKLIFFETYFLKSDEEKAENYIESGSLLLKSGFKEYKLRAYRVLGKGYALKTRNPDNSLQDVLKYQKLSIQNYKKGRSERDTLNVKGYYWATLAIKQILLDDEKSFIHFCNKAFEEFKKAGNEREAEHMFGVIYLYYAKFLPKNKKIEALEIAGNILKKKNVGDYALYELNKSKSEIEPNPTKQKQLRQQALCHLSLVLKSLEENSDIYKKFPQLELRDNQLKLLLKSDQYQIEAHLETDPAKKKASYDKAFEFLSEVETLHPKLKLTAIERSGWLYIETGDFDRAVEKFELGTQINPHLVSLKESAQYANELLRTSFRKTKEEGELKCKFQEQALNGLLLQDDSLNLRDFVPIVLRTIYERGMLF